MERTLFQLFKVPEKNFSSALLTANYHSLLKHLHPDKSPESLSTAQFINTAYSTLKDDYKRSIYEYSLNNKTNLINVPLSHMKNILGTDRVLIKTLEKERIGCNKNVSKDFLSSILDLEEEISSTDIKNIAAVKDEVERRIKECIKNRTELDSLIKWRYYTRLLEMIKKRILHEE
ncbi:hypothetical protein NEOKW01_1144 [Nematocida sp. AWRm80]|nr:hypothetical protein NEOKW01_1144 [Nematocida sp. AWRm80]